MRRHIFHILLSAVALTLMSVVLFATACGGTDQSTTAGDDPVVKDGSTGESGSIVIDGLVDYPMTFTILDMDYMDWVTITADHPQLGPTEYEGVRLSEILSYVGAQSDAKTLIIKAVDGSGVELALADITSDDAMIAVSEDDSLNAVMPGLEAEAWVSDVASMQFK